MKKILFVLVGATIALTLTVPVKAGPRKSNNTEKIIEGVITRYQCGDNCYLTVIDKYGKRHTGLCAVSPCTQWNNAEMPAAYKGRRVKITVGKGRQFDGAGNVMGTFAAFKKVQLVTKPANSSRKSDQ